MLDAEARLATDEEKNRFGAVLGSLVAVLGVLTELRADGIIGDSDGGGGGSAGVCEEPLVGFVEIAWRGKVERTFFPLPLEVKYLTAATKRAFLDEVRSCARRAHAFAHIHTHTTACTRGTASC